MAVIVIIRVNICFSNRILRYASLFSCPYLSFYSTLIFFYWEKDGDRIPSSSLSLLLVLWTGSTLGGTQGDHMWYWELNPVSKKTKNCNCVLLFRIHIFVSNFFFLSDNSKAVFSKSLMTLSSQNSLFCALLRLLVWWLSNCSVTLFACVYLPVEQVLLETEVRWKSLFLQTIFVLCLVGLSSISHSVDTW